MKHREIPFSEPFIDEREVNEVVRVLRGKWITSGPEVTKFEEKVKSYVGCGCAIAVSSATAALEISLAVHDIGPGDEVLTTGYTFASTAIVIVHRGAEPVLVDVEADSFNIDPSKIEAMIQTDYIQTEKGLISKLTGKRLKSIIAVHFGGQSAEIDAINEIAGRYGLTVIEDAAHSIGGVHRGKKIGKSDNFVCFSFYSNKNMTTGEGGMIVTDNLEAEKKIRMYSLHGISKTAIERYQTGLPFYDIVYPGYKANLTDIQAALGVVQIQKLDRITRMRNEVALWYDEYLEEIEEISIPVIRDYNLSARHLYPVLLTPKATHWRNDVIIGLRERGIYPSVHFIPVHFHSYFKSILKHREPLHLPVTEDLFAREISLPLYPGLKKNDVKYVANCLKEVLARLKT